jgi:hypothetical protein
MQPHLVISEPRNSATNANRTYVTTGFFVCSKTVDFALPKVSLLSLEMFEYCISSTWVL